MKVFMALRLYFCIFLGALLVITTMVLAQQPQSMTESPETMELDSKITKSMQDQRWDLERFIEMTNPKEAADLLRKHAEKYGIPLDSTPPSVEVDAERESSRQMERNKNQHLIHLFNGLEFIPMSGVEVSLSEKITSLHKESGSDEKLVCIIQFQGKMTIGDIIELLESDVKIYEDIARRTYLARLPASLVSALSSKSYIRWIGEYKPEYKYEAILSDSKRPEAIIYPMGGDRQEYREDLQRLGVIIKHYDTKVNLYEVLLDNSQFKQVAEEIWWVKGISKIPDDMLHQVNESFEPDDSRELVNAFKTSFTGNGVPIGVRDTGIWHGNTLDFPDGSYDDYGNHGDIGGHGTHVCGIIAARGGRNIEGVYDAKGVAPDATLYVISGVEGIGGNYSYGDAFLYFFAHDILISNHSWGFVSAPGVWLYDYNDDTENIDGWADSDMAIIFSAGNNEDPRTIGNPGTAKNVITVGAINYVEDDYRIPDIGDRAGYSSQGPTADDSRLKPDLVAPGGQRLFCRHGVISTNNSNASDGCTWPSSSWYIGKYGTSMAAPHVTGVCAKIQEWKPDIHSELLKALLINTTIPIKENSDDNLSGYATTAVGYGLVNGFSVTNYYRGESNRLLFGQGVVSEDDPEQDWSISVSPQAMKLIATLAYNDLKGKESDTDVLKDNLDLALISPGGAYYWAHDYLDAADGVTDESPLEKMVITNPESGTWTVKVRFTDGPLFDDPLLRANEVYGVVAHEILKTPSLSLTIPEDQKIIEVWPEEYFALNPRVTNDGGYIATGVTLRIGGGRDFKEDINQTKYVGNLIYQGDNASHQFIIQAPTVPGVYTLTAQADGINKDFDNPDYPRMEQITVKVMKSLTVNTSDDLDDGTCDDSHCSLREALNASNNDPILYQINFNIPGSGPHSIEFSSPLPIITDQIIIDATTQPGYDGEPLIELISPWSNVIDGLVITAGNSIVRGLEINAAGDGIRLQDNGNNLIERNVIHCWYDGISIENSSNNLIGGHLGETGNIIYNNAEGIRITGSGASGNRIVGNIVGTDGYVYYCGNNHNGIYLTNASENTIGGNDAYEANIISGNGENGVYIDGIQSTGNEILGNYIGTDIPGSLNIGNLRNGILIESSSGNFIGPGNIIAYNDEDGVAISSWTIGGNIINPILSNKIYSNEELGIDLIWLDPEVTINDFHDLDAGPNGLQNYPLITSAASDGLGINIYGIMHSNPSTPIRIQFFSNSAYDPSGYGEGERFLGETELTTDANGDARFTKRILGRLFANPYVTATATGPYGTSEFSPYFTAASVLIKEV
ncbi:MAG: S8 family serine peptidase, partial [Calditrichia bacterium]